MVKKRQIRSKLREKKALVSSGRAAFDTSVNADDAREDDELRRLTAAQKSAEASAKKASRRRKKSTDATSGVDDSILTEDAKASSSSDASNALVLPSGPSKEDARAKLEKIISAREERAQLSKKQKKRLSVLQERKRKKERRVELLDALAKVQLTQEQMSIMKATSDIGQKQSKKQRAKTSLKKDRMGIAGDEDNQHMVEVEQEAEITLPADFYAYRKAQEEAANAPPPAPAPATDHKSAMAIEEELEAKSRKRKRKQTNTVGTWKKGETKSFFVDHDDDDDLPSKRRKLDDGSDSDSSEDEETIQLNSVPDDAVMKDAEDDGDEEEGQLLQPEDAGAATVDTSKADSSGARERKLKDFVSLNRPEELQAQREQLPIYMEEQRIMEAIHDNDVVILCGETGSGKTTQIPQFLFEDGFGSSQAGGNPGIIAVTQPRRVAAISVAKRIAEEMGVEPGQEVGYQVRYEKAVGPKTKLKVMTDGILLKEMQNDFLLSKYSVIVLDEAHERNINTDILIGLLSRIVPLRAKLAKEAMKELDESVKGLVPAQQQTHPLKLIVMSATLRVDDFVKNPVLFSPPPPVVHIRSRQFPVTIHFNRVTPMDGYMDEVFRKTCKIHQQLPPGGILIFMTGQREIETMCHRLRKEYPPTFSSPDTTVKEMKDDESSGDGDGESTQPKLVSGMYVLPLYSMLPTAKQMRVFDPVPDGNRLVVVATNIAETSITIPGIRYVVDTGKAKEKVYVGDVGMSKFQVGWTSKAASDQRAGRAGRTGPGHCYRLYSSNVFQNYFDGFSAPELTRTPVEGVILLMKSMGIDKVESFPFPSPPDAAALRNALVSLYHLGALSSPSDEFMSSSSALEMSPSSDNWSITKMGRTLSAFPVAPRFAKVLALGKQGGCLPYAIIIVAALSVGNPLLRDSFKVLDEDEPEPAKEGADREAKDRSSKKARRRAKHMKKTGRVSNVHSKWQHPLSDLLTILKAVGAYEYHVYQAGGDAEEFCEKNYLHAKSMKEIHQLSHELASIIDTLTGGTALHLSAGEQSEEREQLVAMLGSGVKGSLNVQPPTAKQEIMLRQIVTAALVDRVATLAGGQILTSEETTGPGRRKNRFEFVTSQDNVTAFIHPSSVLFQMNPPPEYVAYTEIVESSASKRYIRNVTAISPSWLPNLGKSLCTVDESNVLGKPHIPTYNRVKDQVRCLARPSYAGGWKLPVQEVQFPISREYYRWFARFLLAGDVMDGFRKIEPMLVAKPSLVTQSWNVKKVNVLVETLVAKKASSRTRLMELWEADPNFLLSAVQLWVNTADAEKLAGMWPLTETSKRSKKKKKAPTRAIDSVEAAPRTVMSSTADDPDIEESEESSSEDEL